MNHEAEALWEHLTLDRYDSILSDLPVHASWHVTRYSQIAHNNRLATEDAVRSCGIAAAPLQNGERPDVSQAIFENAKEDLERQCFGGMTEDYRKRKDGSPYTRSFLELSCDWLNFRDWSCLEGDSP